MFDQFAHYGPLVGCNAKIGISYLGPKNRGWRLLSYLYDYNIPNLMSEALMLSNQCQWDAITNPNPIPNDPNFAVIDPTFIPYEKEGIAAAYVTCWNGFVWACGK